MTTRPTPSAKSLVLDLLATLPAGHPMPVATLIAAGELFGITPNNTRVALARLLSAGRVERDHRGRYHASPKLAQVQRWIVSWRRLSERTRPWRGGWVSVCGAHGRASARALRLVGFRNLRPGLALRPDNRVGGVEEARTTLRALGLPSDALVFALSGLDSASDTRARALWDQAELQRGYENSLATLAASEARLDRLPATEAMVESFCVGGAVIRQLRADPLLPDAIAPGAARDELVRAMRAYERRGRARWADFMRGFGVLDAQVPSDLRSEEAARGLAVAAGGTR